MLPTSIVLQTTLSVKSLYQLFPTRFFATSTLAWLERVIRRNRTEAQDTATFAELRWAMDQDLAPMRNMMPNVYIRFDDDYTYMRLSIGTMARSEVVIIVGRETLVDAEARKSKFLQSPAPRQYGVVRLEVKFKRTLTKVNYGEYCMADMAIRMPEHPVLINGDAFEVGSAYAAIILELSGRTGQAYELWDDAREKGWDEARWG